MTDDVVFISASHPDNRPSKLLSMIYTRLGVSHPRAAIAGLVDDIVAYMDEMNEDFSDDALIDGEIEIAE